VDKLGAIVFVAVVAAILLVSVITSAGRRHERFLKMLDEAAKGRVPPKQAAPESPPKPMRTRQDLDVLRNPEHALSFRIMDYGGFSSPITVSSRDLYGGIFVEIYPDYGQFRTVFKRVAETLWRSKVVVSTNEDGDPTASYSLTDDQI
jgi:hypothetical protein